MPQSDGKHKLKRMEIEFKGKSYVFNINPEEYTQEEPSRSTVTQTKRGAWIDDFGAGLPIITIAGHTGWKSGGVEKFKALRKVIRDYYGNTKPGQKVTDEMILHNFTDDESWVVHPDPTGFRMIRSVSQPLLYRYEMRFICIRRADTPPPSNTTGGVMITLGSALPIATAAIAGQANYAAIIPLLQRELNVNSPPPANTLYFMGSLETVPGGKIKGFQQFTVSNPPSNVDERVQAVTAQFDPNLSQLAQDMLYNIKSNFISGNLVDPNDGTIAGYIKDLNDKVIPNDIKVALKAVILETYSILVQLMDDPTALPQKMSISDIHRLVNNIRWVADQLFKLELFDHELYQKLLTLERAIKYIENSELYRDTLKSEMDSIRGEE